MNIRHSGYSDYGITEKEAQQIIESCNAGGIDLHTVLECAEMANPGIAKEIFGSIVYGASFEKIDTLSHIPIYKNDFYGYRRKTIALIREKIGTQKNRKGNI